MSTCFNCDAELETTLPGATKNALCDSCRKDLQAKVDRAIQGIEADILQGIYGKNHTSAVRTIVIAAICTVAVAVMFAVLLGSLVGLVP